MFKGTLFSISFPALVIFCLFDKSHSNWSKVIPHCVLICISVMIRDVKYFFHIPVCHLNAFLWEMSSQVFCLFLNQIICVSAIELFQFSFLSNFIPHPWTTINLVSVSVDFYILDIHINGIIKYMVFCTWFLSLSIIFSRFNHVVACIHTLFLFIASVC